MSLKINSSIGIYDLSFKAAITSLIKEGFIYPELIDSLYTDCAVVRSKDSGLSVEEEKASIQAEFSPWVWLCFTSTVDCVKLKPYGTDDTGKVLYTCGGITRTCRPNLRKSPLWSGRYGTLEDIRKFCVEHNKDKTFVTICCRNSVGELEPIGYVM